MADALMRRLVPDDLWNLVEPLLPKAPKRPQGGGRARADARSVFAAVTLVLSSNGSWRSVPSSFGVAVPTAHRWFARWTVAGVWEQLRLAASRQKDPELAEWVNALVDAAMTRARATNRGSMSAMAVGAMAELPARVVPKVPGAPQTRRPLPALSGASA